MAFRKPKDYDSVKVGEARILPAGGYVCKILKAEETESKTGKPMLKVFFDITSGEFEGYFKDMYQNWKAASDDSASVKWPFTGTKWILFYNNEGATNRDFKSFCTALEDHLPQRGTRVQQRKVVAHIAVGLQKREDHRGGHVQCP